jgi:hypothetical protein
MNLAPVIDHSQALAGGMALVPDQAAIAARNQQMRMQAQALEMQQMQMQQAVAERQQQQERAAAWQQRVQGLMADPNPRAIRAALLEFPEQREALTAALGNPNDEAVQGSLRQMTSIYGALEAGNTDRAATLVEQRIAADTAAGQPPDEDDAAMLAALRSGDPAQVNQARTMIGMTLAALPGSDDFFQNIERMNGGGGEPIAMQRQYEFIRRTAGEQAAANFLARQSDRTQWVEGRGLVQLPDAPIPNGGNREGGDPASGIGGAPANERTAVIRQALEAVRQGANEEAVIQRLLGMGYTEADLRAAMAAPPAPSGSQIRAQDARAMIQSMGRPAFDAWRRRHNVTIRQ